MESETTNHLKSPIDIGVLPWAIPGLYENDSGAVALTRSVALHLSLQVLSAQQLEARYWRRNDAAGLAF